ncbi:hypothetical protein IFR05_000963 [Cadophora sp. M221]|nr:hypothetical protein IFR05_000963 [Cadophora sp. M221]
MANQETSISFDILAPQGEMRSAEDNWSGVTSSAERRRVQNRLSQRAWRKRHKSNRWHKDIITKATGLATINSTSGTLSSVHEQQFEGPVGSQYHAIQSVQTSNVEFNSTNDTSVPGPESYIMSIYLSRRRISLCDLSEKEIADIENYFEKHAKHLPLSESPTNDQLLPLIQFNAFRALLANVRLLGLRLERICDDDYVSPFNQVKPDKAVLSSLPSSLHPTSLQRMVVHHPWLDFFPFPVVRDNLIRAGDTFDDDQLCVDLIGFCTAPSEKTGLIIWGEPWSPQGWEVSESFVRNWAWVISGCSDLMVSTNYWRVQRGEKPLFKL